MDKKRFFTIKKPIIFDGIKFDSNEELEFYHWCKEAEAAKIITRFEYHPAPFTLYEKEKYCSIKTITYSPDFLIFFPAGELHKSLFNCELISQKVLDEYLCYVEVKSDIGRKALLRSRDVTFPIKQAWLYQRSKIFVNKVIARHIFNPKGKIIHPGFFSKTWVPVEVAWMKNRKEATRIKAFADCKLLSEVLNDIQ